MLESSEGTVYGTVLIKAKEIMDYILNAPEAPTLKEISDNVAITKSTVLKILRTLELCGYIRRTDDDKRYYLGTMFLAYAQKVSDTFDIRQVTEPILTKLRDDIGETVNLGIVENHKITLLDKIESPSSVYLVSRVGGQMHMYSSSMGKSVLAGISDRELQNYIEHTQFEKLTTNTLVDAESLKRNLKEVQAQGYALDDEENQADIYCVGFSLRKDGKVYGAFSVSMPKYRADEAKVDHIIASGKQAQQEILQAL